MANLTDQSSFWADDGDGVREDGETVYYDLTNNKDEDPTTGSEAEINGALFFTDQPDSSAGTGLIQAFVRVQDGGNDDTPGFENGYNTSWRPLSYEENTSPSFTTDLYLSSVPVVTIDGVDYYEFRLDINQLNSSPLLSLDALKVYITDESDGPVSGLISDPSFTDITTEVYNLDGAGDSSILLDYSLQAGSGKSDMFFYIPVSNFNGADPSTTLVTLYSEFGAAGVLGDDETLLAINDPGDHDDIDDAADGAVHGTYTANDGFEEWSVSKTLDDNFIWGYKWEDSDGDGTWDLNESGEGGFIIDYTITYKDGNGSKAEIVTISGSVVTSDGTTDYDGDGNLDPVGYYVIPVPLGAANNTAYTITLTERAREDWVNTYDGDATVDRTTTFTFDENTLEDSPETISGVLGQTVTMNFGNYEYGSIEGTKYEDADGDGTTTDDQTAKEGWNIYLFSSDPGADPDVTQADDSTTTDSNGDYSFDNLAPGTYWVVEETRDGWFNVSPVTVNVGTQTSGFDVNDVDFVNFQDMNLSGYKWADVDGNGDWNEPDIAVLSGWTIVIDNDLDPTNGYLLAEITGSDGKYEFTGLNVNTLTEFGNGDVLGNYTNQTLYVYEIQKDGFVQTYGGYTFTITSGLVVSGALGVAEEGNFGNEMLLGANRTPGFWQSTLGKSLYDGDDDNNGDANGDGVPDGDKNFEEEGWSTTDLLTKYGVDLLDENGDPGSDGINDTFILWDENGDGIFDQGQDIFLTAAELHEWVSGGKADEKGGLDGLEKLERDLGAAFLNTLNNHSLATPGSNSEDPQIIETIVDDDIYDSYTAAVEFILKYDQDLDGEADLAKGALQKKWKDDASFGDDNEDGFIQNDGNSGITGSQAHIELSAFNENGEAMVDGEMVQILMDGDDYSSDPVQNYLQVQDELLQDQTTLEFSIDYSLLDGFKDDAMIYQDSAVIA